jgi:hypothetical protein
MWNSKYVLSFSYCISGLSFLCLGVTFDCSKYECNGEQRNMAVTQFEAADARRCFPCWDEPAFKVIFFVFLAMFSSGLTNSRPGRNSCSPN